ncbi:hypothetical protein [Halomonas sp.]|uniref:hypothetical protein n=1 Tax=Halomonas sp. TaxID=1486246 RepID=UPI0025810B5A|nr:hypothetical protein [Halomonas sp.]MCJ8286906.1 hypothetical protein [Halomonas sp.]NQY71620.1 transposase [Halomonas sp.]
MSNKLTVSLIEGWIEEAHRSIVNGFRARPTDILEQYDSDPRLTKEAAGEVHLQIYPLKK